MNGENSSHKLISEEEIRTCISKLKNHKASDVDNIINEYIKATKDILMPVYIRIFKCCRKTAVCNRDQLLDFSVPELVRS